MDYSKSYYRNRRFKYKDDLILEKILDLVNIAIGGLVIGQFFNEEPFNLVVMMLTLSCAFFIYIFLWYIRSS